jgi:O-antigen/teichoic acid export membrane protein
VLGSLFFYFISIYLTKEVFGMIGWMNAISLFITTLLGFGLEQVVTRRIASSDRSDWAAGAFLINSLGGFLITLAVLLLLNYIAGNNNPSYKYLPWFFAAQGLIFIGTPLKQFLNVKEKFTPYGIIAFVSNSGKIISVFILQQNHQLAIQTVIIVLVSSAIFEFVALLIYICIKTNFSFKFKFQAYVKLMKESSAQYISVIFDMSLSRMDWILLGMMTTNIMLADYSFAYRAFELARLPMLIIAPLLLPRLSRLMYLNSKPQADHQQQINSFNKVEICFVMLIPLALNILWAPVVSLITHGKYGISNSSQFLILSLCIPLQLFINLLWSLSFAAKKYKQVTTITVCCAIVNVSLNLLLIPKFNGLGSAIAFFTTTFLQCGLYYRLVYRHIMIISLRPAILLITTAMVTYLIAIHIPVHFIIQLCIALISYMLVAVLTGQINRQHVYNFKKLLS